MHSDQMRIEAELTIRAAIEAVRSANLNEDALFSMLTLLLTAEVTALLERAARESLEHYAAVEEDELQELSAGDGQGAIKLTNAKGESPQLDIGIDPDRGLVFSPPQTR